MCRLLGYCSQRDRSLTDVLGPDGLREFTGMCALHGDGWGMAWYAGAEPVSRKSPARADTDPGYSTLTTTPLTDLGLLHLRWATPGLSVNEANSHPFRYGNCTFAHNGAIRPQDRLPQLLPPERERQLGGTTDSERYFLLIMAELAGNGGDMVAAIAKAAAAIDARFETNSLNAILLSPEKLYAVSWYNSGTVPAATLRSAGYGEPEIAAYFDLRYTAAGDAVVVASSGWPQPGWATLPNHHVLITDRHSLVTQVLPL